jgi:Galactose oxidase, central domain
MPIAFVNNKMFTCGGFLAGTTPGYPAIQQCFMYTHGNVPGTQWVNITSLPDIRAGGAMFFDSIRNSIYYATGADIHAPNPPRAVDWSTMWELSITNPSAGWIQKNPTPYAAGHVGFTSVKYQGIDRHYLMGGQQSHNTETGQFGHLFEYNSVSDTWTQKRSMLRNTTHIQSSVLPYKTCGLLVVGGKYSNTHTTNDIVYYDIGTNTWTKIGGIPSTVSSTVCDLINDILYCQSGCIGCDFSWRIRVE